LAFVSIAPLLTRPLAEVSGVPLGLIAQIVLFGMSLDRARHEVTPPRENVSLAQA
jgi:hypothetical protein